MDYAAHADDNQRPLPKKTATAMPTTAVSGDIDAFVQSSATAFNSAKTKPATRGLPDGDAIWALPCAAREAPTVEGAPRAGATSPGSCI